jgi:hypothetical protein
MTQTTLFDDDDWKRKKADGMARADAHADGTWKDAAIEIIRFFAETRDTFSGWEITKELTARNMKTPTKRALGPLLVMAAAKGWIEKTDIHRPNPLAHGCPSPLWKSRIR